jgi:nucleoside-diphosphate-sugar epimerase
VKRVLVTGAGGYLGVPLCRKLLESGYSVIALDRFFFGLDKLDAVKNNPDITVLKEDIRYFDTGILKDVDAVIDLAGLSNDASAEIDVRLTDDINCRGAARLAQAAKANGVRRYVYSSSTSVYGAGSKEGLSESDELRPQTEYARSKVATEKYLLGLEDKSFEPVLLRNATIFGLAPRMRFDLAINIMTMRAWKERVIYIMGGGEQWRPFVHVEDVAGAMLLALESPAEKVTGEVFNVGSNEQNYKIRHLSQFVIDVIPNVKIHMIPDDPDKRTYNVNFDKIQNTLGYKTSVGIHEGVKEILHALEKGIVEADDPTTHTLQWYKSLITWGQRIQDLSYNGRII